MILHILSGLKGEQASTAKCGYAWRTGTNRRVMHDRSEKRCCDTLLVETIACESSICVSTFRLYWMHMKLYGHTLLGGNEVSLRRSHDIYIAWSWVIWWTAAAVPLKWTSLCCTPQSAVASRLGNCTSFCVIYRRLAFWRRQSLHPPLVEKKGSGLLRFWGSN